MKIKQSANKHFEKELPKAAGKTLTIVRSPTGVQAKSKRSLQGRLNPKLPINQIIVTYTPDVVTNVESSDSEASGNESETSDVASVKDESVRGRFIKEESKHLAYSIIENETAIGLPGRNVILSKTKINRLYMERTKSMSFCSNRARGMPCYGERTGGNGGRKSRANFRLHKWSRLAWDLANVKSIWQCQV